MLVATHSRYVVDLNRPPDGASLYPGARNTELCPLTTFDDEPIYRPGTEPGSDEIARRRAAYWDPYHQRLASEIAGLRERHGFVLVWDAHSIRSRVPRFFEGRLAELNLGTARGTSADPALGPRLLALAEQTPGYSAVLDGRFTGGYITRHYGTPATNAHVVQLELTQECYMDESPPYLYRGDLASRIQPVIRALIECALDHLHTVRRPH
jgi:N-formylglutamate deformylase